MEESWYVRFLYETIPGRAVLKLLVQPPVSKAAGVFLDSGISKCLIPQFIRKNHIDTWDIIVPEGGFTSFNQFFSRKRENEEIKQGQNALISPCDAFLSLLPINRHSYFHVKHTLFSVGGLLQNETLAEQYKGGYALVFRLTPAHYHRYVYAASGKVTCKKKIPGVLHCVRPLVTEKIPVYVQNAREYQVLQTKEYGKIIQTEIGAMLVGKITNHPLRENRLVNAGEEKGYFEFGGSTVILLVQKDKVKFKEWVYQAIKEEIPVRQGTVIGN